jgi:hypothetical protein
MFQPVPPLVQQVVPRPARKSGHDRDPYQLRFHLRQPFFFFFFFFPKHKVSRLLAGGGNAFTHGRVSSNSVGLWPLGLLPTKTSPKL